MPAPPSTEPAVQRERDVGGENVLQLVVVEGAGFGVEPQDRDEKERGWNKGVEEKLQRGLRAALGSEDGDKIAIGTSESSQKP